MTDRQAALREALERKIAWSRGLFSLCRDDESLTGELLGKLIVSLEYALKRLGHCNTCRGVGHKFIFDRFEDSHGVLVPCPDCVADELELLGKMGK